MRKGNRERGTEIVHESFRIAISNFNYLWILVTSTTRYHRTIDFISPIDRVRLKVNKDDYRGLSSILSDYLMDV